MLLSTSAVSYTSYVFFFSPSCLTVYNSVVVPFSVAMTTILGYLPELQVNLAGPARELSLGLSAFLTNVTTDAQAAQLIYGLEVARVASEAVVYVGFSLLLLVLLSSVTQLQGLSARFSRIKGALVAAVLPNLTFLTGAEAVVVLLFLFMTLYFLEVHFFFVFTLGLSSDSLVYQFNFLLSGFLFVFLFKFWRGLATDSLFFSVAPLFNSYLFFSQANVSDKSSSSTNLGGTSIAGLASTASFTVRGLFFVIFFFVTFIVWALRYVIQFIRLLVLFMIHTVFEFAIISNDTYFSGVNHFGFFFFKSFFFIFLIFWGFMYLLVYLNLMFTLQAFIFFFFSEVFQSNFLFDLSAVVSSRVSLIKS